MNLLLILLPLLRYVDFSASAPTPNTDWTFKQALNYAVEKGGPLSSNPVAQLITNHVESKHLSWEDIYTDTLHSPDGAFLELAPELRKRGIDSGEGEILSKRLDLGISQDKSQLSKSRLQKRATYSVRAYLWTNNCSGTNYHWPNVVGNNFQCYAYWNNGQTLRMYSLRTSSSNSNTYLVTMWRDTANCKPGSNWASEGSGQMSRFVQGSNQCSYTADGRGFASWQVADI